jgi:hypothetical protein
MKAKRRRELKENILAHELAQLRQFLGKYGSWIALAIVAVAVVLVVVWRLRAQERATFAREKQELEVLQLHPDMPRKDRLDGFRRLAESAETPVVAASSAVDAANMYSQDAVRAADPDGPEARQARENAARYYRMALERHAKVKPKLSLTAASAHYGLGILAENQGDKAAARNHYEQALALGGKEHLAGERLQRLDEWFAARRFPATRPATAPATASAPAASGPASRLAPGP